MNKTVTFAILMVLCICVLSPGALSAQQRFQFSQYMFNGLVLNPGYAGADESLSLTFYNRSQWSKVDGAPKTQTLSVHNLFRKKLGLGLQLLNDKVGVHTNYSVNASVAYHLQVASASFVSFGMQGGLGHRESDYLSLGPNLANDPKIGNASLAYNQIEMGAGVYFRSPRLQMGISVPQFLPASLQVNDTLSLNIRSSQFFFLSRYRIPVSSKINIEPGIMLKYLNGVPLSFDLYTSVTFHKVLVTGISYRKNESIDLLLKAQVTPQLQLGYGYDHVIGQVAALSQASHEVMVNYQFRLNRHNITTPR